MWKCSCVCFSCCSNFFFIYFAVSYLFYIIQYLFRIQIRIPNCFSIILALHQFVFFLLKVINTPSCFLFNTKTFNDFFFLNLNYLFPFTICSLRVWLSLLISECIKTQVLIKLYKPSVSALKCWQQKQKHIIKSFLRIVSVNIYIKFQCSSLSIFAQLTFSL